MDALNEAVRKFVHELVRTDLLRSSVAVMRYAKVTEVDMAGRLVRTSLTGSAWLQVPLWWSPTASDVGRRIQCTQQGQNWVVSSVLL